MRIIILTLAMLLCIPVLATSAAEKAGQTTKTKNEVKGVLENNTRNLTPGNEVYTQENISTGKESQADLKFLDDSNLTMGPTSTVKLDKFIYDPSRNTGDVVLNATRGSFRYVTGKQVKGNYRVRTPYGTLGVRG